MNWTENEWLDLIRMGRDYAQLVFPVPARITFPDGRVRYGTRMEAFEVPVGYLRRRP